MCIFEIKDYSVLSKLKLIIKLMLLLTFVVNGDLKSETKNGLYEANLGMNTSIRFFLG